MERLETLFMLEKYGGGGRARRWYPHAQSMQVWVAVVVVGGALRCGGMRQERLDSSAGRSKGISVREMLVN